jgi:hypothetical protein
MVVRRSYEENLRIGHHFEDIALSLIDPYVKVNLAPKDKKFDDWDIQAYHKTGEVISYEVKADLEAKKTGNFFIEIKDKFNQPSGLLLTKSDYYLLIKTNSDNSDVDESYLIPTEMLVEYNNTKKYRFVFGGNGAYGFLLPERDIIQLCS